VQRTELVDGASDQTFCVRRAGDVGLKEKHSAAAGANLAGCPGATVGINITDADRGAFGGHRFRRGAPDA
jgi:hypothetical protein